MVGKGRKPGVRNKFKQVLFIEGHPDILYMHKLRYMTTLNIGKQTFSLGVINSSLHEHLRKIPDSELIVSEKQTEKTRGIDGFTGLHIRKAGENTTIEVSAESEEALFNKILKLRSNLEKNNVPITERCSWVCTVDKGKEIDSNAIKSNVTDAPGNEADKTEDVSSTPENDSVETEKTLTDDILKSEGTRKKKGVRSEDKVKKTQDLKEMVAKMGIT